MLSLPRSVMTITPQRLSFAGGGTDLPGFYERHGGAVVSSTIDKYIYVTVKRHMPLFNEAYRLSYSKTERIDDLNDIENDVARECLRLVQVDPPLFITTAADLPQKTGLGSSSSFAVGLLYALHVIRGEDVSAGQLAEEACHVEIGVLGHPIGKQDQYAAAFGGLNYMAFQRDGRVHLDSVHVPDNGVANLFCHFMLFWTGVQRDAREVLREQRDNIDVRATLSCACAIWQPDAATSCWRTVARRPPFAMKGGREAKSGEHDHDTRHRYDVRACPRGRRDRRQDCWSGRRWISLSGRAARTSGTGARGAGRARRTGPPRGARGAAPCGSARVRRNVSIFLTGTESFIGRALLEACRVPPISGREGSRTTRSPYSRRVQAAAASTPNR